MYVSPNKSNDEYRAGGIAVLVKSNIETITCTLINFQSADIINLEFKLNSNIFLYYQYIGYIVLVKIFFSNKINDYFEVNNLKLKKECFHNRRFEYKPVRK